MRSQENKAKPVVQSKFTTTPAAPPVQQTNKSAAAEILKRIKAEFNSKPSNVPAKKKMTAVEALKEIKEFYKAATGENL